MQEIPLTCRFVRAAATELRFYIYILKKINKKITLTHKETEMLFKNNMHRL